jgi:carbamoyltransferase
VTSILGIAAFFHDSAAAIIVDGRVVAASQEERFSRIKHDDGFPTRSVQYCLDAAGITADQLDHVAFYEKPLAKFDRLLETYLAAAPKGRASFTAAMPRWLQTKLHVRRQIRRSMSPRYAGPIWFCDHHQSHAASAFYPSPFDQAAIITIDGVGEWATTSIGVGRGRSIMLQHEIRFPDSIGLLYSAFTYHAGFTVNSGEYKLMGLAPYGRPLYADAIREALIDIRPDGSYRLTQDYFDYASGLTMTNAKFDALFGHPRRDRDQPIRDFDRDMAASIQAVTEDVVLRIAAHAKSLTGMRHVCLAGGVALNCVANGRLLREGPFDDVWVQPAAGDAGGALGAAWWAWHDVLENDRVAEADDAQRGSLLGPSFTEAQVAATLDSHGVPYTRVDSTAIADVVAESLANGDVVGRFAGRAEFGPRALGNRSILADPRGASTQDRINQRIKFRESFRPFAPAVLADKTADWFDVGDHGDSPYMMFVHPVGQDAPPVPAVTHVDGTARVQTVDARRHRELESLLRSFFQRTGCPMLVNTSFNLRGEPIVGSPEDAVRCFLKSDLDLLVIENFVVRRSDVGDVQLPAEKRSRWRVLATPLRAWNRWLTAVGLAIVYHGVLTPTAWWRRWGKPVDRRNQETYWQAVAPEQDPDRHRRTF